MTNEEKVVPFRSIGDSRRQTMRQERLRVVNACREEISRVLFQLSDDFFEKADDTLYGLAEKTASSPEHYDYFIALRELRLHRERVQQRWRQMVLERFDRFWQGEAGRRAARRDSPDMELLEEEELEEYVATTEAAGRAEKRFEKDLFALERRFSELLEGAEVNKKNNPLAPLALCEQFREAIRPLDLGIHSKLVLYKRFDKDVIHYIGGLYEELNSRLDHAGILPGLTPTVRSHPVAPAVRKAEGVAEQPVPENVHEVSAASMAYDENDAFTVLQQMLHRRRHAGRETQTSAPAGVQVYVVTTKDLVSALSELQRSNLAAATSFDGDLHHFPREHIKLDLAHALHLGQNGMVKRRLAEEQLDVLDVASMLFDFLLEDRGLADAMKALLLRLQIPMAKIAIVDDTFFRNKAHPARRLLNNLTHMAFLWSDDGDRSENSWYGRIESYVNRVLIEFENDPAVLDQVSQELSAFLEKEARDAEVAEERTRQVSKGREQLRVARRRVEEEIESRLALRENVPEIAQRILREAWKDVLLLNYLRQGPESGSWRHAVSVVDRLLWSVERKTSPLARDELLTGIPELLSKLREGLEGIAYDPHAMGKLFKDLQARHIICLRALQEPVSAAAAADQGPATAAQETAAAESRSEKATPVPDVFLRRAADLQEGDWLETLGEDGGKVRAKLAWKSDASDVYLLVNRKGLKFAEMSTKEIAALLLSGTAEVLHEEQVPLVERALVSMMQVLSSGDHASRTD